MALLALRWATRTRAPGPGFRGEPASLQLSASAPSTDPTSRSFFLKGRGKISFKKFEGQPSTALLSTFAQKHHAARALLLAPAATTERQLCSCCSLSVQWLFFGPPRDVLPPALNSVRTPEHCRAFLQPREFSCAKETRSTSFQSALDVFAQPLCGAVHCGWAFGF